MTRPRILGPPCPLAQVLVGKRAAAAMDNPRKGRDLDEQGTENEGEKSSTHHVAATEYNEFFPFKLLLLQQYFLNQT